METYFLIVSLAFVAAPLVISLFGIDHTGYNSGEKTVGLWLFTFLLYLIVFLVTTAITDYYEYNLVDRSKCEFTQTSSTTYVECEGGIEAKTDAHYIYKHYQDSTEVGVYELIPKSDTGLSLLIEKNVIKKK